MDKTQRIAAIIATEAGRFPGQERQAEQLRWAVWMCWEEFGCGPETMNSSEFADAAALHGVGRGTAMNRYSDAKRNWALMED